MVTAYIALGANLGDAAAALQQAVAEISKLPDTRVSKVSSIYKTEPIGSDPQRGPVNDYLNAVIEVQTGFNAPALLQQLQQIELSAGRERPYLNAPRTLDLDVLLYGSASIASANLTVPHPRMWQRAFVLVPLAEIASGLFNTELLTTLANQPITRLSALIVKPEF